MFCHFVCSFKYDLSTESVLEFLSCIHSTISLFSVGSRRISLPSVKIMNRLNCYGLGRNLLGRRNRESCRNIHSENVYITMVHEIPIFSTKSCAKLVSDSLSALVPVIFQVD
jgi:hypothetical protein